MTRALATVALGSALVLAAATFDTPSLYVPGLALAVLALAATAWVRLAARGASVTSTPGPTTVVEEEPYPVRLRVRTGPLPLPGGELIEPLLGWSVPVGGRWSRRVRVDVRFSRRGPRRLEPAVLAVRDPLGIHERKVRGGRGGDLLVLPRLEAVEAPVGGGSGRAQSAGDGRPAGRRLDSSAAELDLDGLRPYRTGTPASRIAWSAVARTREMVERRLVPDADSAPLVVVDAARPASEEDLDKAVRAAASLCLHLARAGGCSLLLPGERRPIAVGRDLGAWPKVHARLALVRAGGGVRASPRALRCAAVFWVSASGGAHLPRPLERLGATAGYLVTPSPRPGYRTSFTVAGCSGQRVDRAYRSAPARAVA